MGEFTSNLKKYRQLAGLTQETLAERVRVRRETILRLEAGRYNPSLKLAVDISRAVGAPIEAIFEFPEDGDGPSQA
ncbi:helix-turn-helix transcriptional regulator [Ruminococcaceae bacterium OttesenSCG-928-D13]|nr:helix-turn-helix transcriptional regulator [Ruminococcaceae bacterium OttesenSCG-928-D13]